MSKSFNNNHFLSFPQQSTSDLMRCVHFHKFIFFLHLNLHTLTVWWQWIYPNNGLALWVHLTKRALCAATILFYCLGFSFWKILLFGSILFERSFGLILILWPSVFFISIFTQSNKRFVVCEFDVKACSLIHYYSVVVLHYAWSA